MENKTIAQRAIKRTWKVELKKHSDIHSAGLVLPPGNWEEFDPFLLMAEDIFQQKAFDHHPHRGMETVTYIIDGEMHHTDDKGGKGIIKKGDVQWMTAGRGLNHLEEPPANTAVHSLQLWVNLPRAQKMTTPRYQDIIGAEAPVRQEEGVTYRVFSGSSGNLVSPTKNHALVTMVEIEIEAGATAVQNLPADYNGFMFILEGSGTFGSHHTEAQKGEVLLLDAIQGDATASEIRIQAKEKMKVIFLAGLPLKEPVVAKGPFVMNTEEEIKQAYADYRAGKF